MGFQAVLNEYIELLGCTSTELSNASGLSVSTISRYRSGGNAPGGVSQQLVELAKGIAELSAAKCPDNVLDDRLVLERLSSSISGVTVPHDNLLRNLGELLEAIDIPNSSLAKALSFDPSYISRILSGRRRPRNMRSFISQTSTYLARRCTDAQRLNALSYTIERPLNELETSENRAAAILAWLGSNTKDPANPLEGFLRNIDNFDLNDFVNAMRFDSAAPPVSDSNIPVSKTYYGLKEMMQAELDFLEATVLSESAEGVINYSDMPLGDMAREPDFPKQWIAGVTAVLKRRLNLYIIHDVNRPLAEMMIGLENWIPMYMTGQVHPYYLPTSQSSVFCHLLKTSGGAALAGEAIAGYQPEGRYYLTRDPKEVEHFKRQAERLLKKARPLMRIYAQGENDEEIDKLRSSKDITPPEFNNISIVMHEDRLVVVTKLNDPVMHFVIEHPKMVRAFESFVAPITEE